MSGTDRSCTLGGGFQGKNRPFTEKLRARNEDAVAPEQLSCSRKLSADKLTSAEVARATWAAAAVAVLVVGPAGRARSPPSFAVSYSFFCDRTPLWDLSPFGRSRTTSRRPTVHPNPTCPPPASVTLVPRPSCLTVWLPSKRMRHLRACMVNLASLSLTLDQNGEDTRAALPRVLDICAWADA